MKLDEVIMPASAIDVAPNLGTKAAIKYNYQQDNRRTANANEYS
jgi:hypothetical protein